MPPKKKKKQQNKKQTLISGKITVNDPFHTINVVNFLTRKKWERERRIKKIRTNRKTNRRMGRKR
jgi:hypothetical protein